MTPLGATSAERIKETRGCSMKPRLYWWTRLSATGLVMGLLLCALAPWLAGELPAKLVAAAEPETLVAETVEPPARLVIPTINVDASIDPVGIDWRGEMGSTGPDRVGWLTLTARPGAMGAAVLAGHLDWGTRAAVFWRLRELRPGASIFVDEASGDRHQFVVREVAVYPWQNAPMSRIYGSGTAPTLRLVTCAGSFNPTTHNYDQRLVVYADLVIE